MNAAMLVSPARMRWSVVLLAIACMWSSVLISEWVKPRQHWAEVIGEPHYATLVPSHFGDWDALEYGSRAVLNPVQEQRLLELYTETLARSYVHRPTGRVLMLSVAYGKDQSTDTQIHTPEACYPSQGFRVDRRADHDLTTTHGVIPAVRVWSSLGSQRIEPLTYFIRVGDGMARGSRDRNLARLKMALHGYLIDGMLFRVSEISADPNAHALQDQFIRDLLNHVNDEDRRRLIGAESTSR
jgi:EpsI family protein